MEEESLTSLLSGFDRVQDGYVCTHKIASCVCFCYLVRIDREQQRLHNQSAKSDNHGDEDWDPPNVWLQLQRLRIEVLEGKRIICVFVLLRIGKITTDSRTTFDLPMLLYKIPQDEFIQDLNFRFIGVIVLYDDLLLVRPTGDSSLAGRVVVAVFAGFWCTFRGGVIAVVRYG